MIWVLLKFFLVVEYYGYKDCVILECSMDDFSLVINLCFNVILMFILIVYVFWIWNFLRNFNEVKYIGVMMYILCFVWIVFFFCYLNVVDSIWKFYFLCSLLFFIGIIILLGFFVLKVFFVYFGIIVELCGDIVFIGIMDDKSRSEYCRDIMIMVF